MKTLYYFLILIATLSLLSTNSKKAIDPERQWSQYRGYRSSGVLDKANLPEKWDLKTRENILWKYEVPGLGLSSPVIWGDKLFITTAISEKDQEGLKEGIYGDIEPVNDDSEHEWRVICLNKSTGEIEWERTSHRGIPGQKRHPKSSHANCSVATDGKSVVAFFGSEGLYSYDMNGNLKWKKDFGVLRSVFFRVESAEWEFASSPIIVDDKVIVQCDVMENSFVAAYDADSGKEIWKKERDEYPGWCTPNMYESSGRKMIALNGFKHRGGYDLETGEEIWRMRGGGDIQIPTPVVGDGLIYFNSAHGPQSPILAISTDASGDITLNSGDTANEFVKWSIPRGGSYMQTMVLYEGLLYNLKWNGQLDCYDAATGEQYYKEKMGRALSFTASPVVADGILYAVGDDGKVFSIQCGKDFKVLATNELNDISMVTPAISDGTLFFRTQDMMVAVGRK